MVGAVCVVDPVSLIPVIELLPWQFSTQERAMPPAGYDQFPEDWLRYWQDSLADSGITGLHPYPGPFFHVPAMALVDAGMLERVLRRLIDTWGGVESLSDPDSDPVLDGGLALASAQKVLLTPTCCSDLGNVAEWQEAALYRGAAWKMLWIGHPWISIRYEPPALLLSEPHESHDPVEKWAVSPHNLDRALSDAVRELERFAGRVASVLGILGYLEDPAPMARKLCRLCE
jgi:hypothetical protein